VQAFASMYVCANVRDWLVVLVVLWIKYTQPRRTNSRTWQPSVHEPVRVQIGMSVSMFAGAWHTIALPLLNPKP
jgi:hypothetical protein